MNSGKKAVEMLKTKHYDIVLMDHMMPVMDGIETLKLIKDNNLIDDTTIVIALTANAIAGAREMYLKEGFRDYLSKPIVPVQLEKMLVQYLPEGSYEYESDESDAQEKEGGLVGALRLKGFNVDAAMTYCMNDEEFFRQEKTEAITAFYKDKNWADYSTYVHALKSSARTIGADKLSKMALEQENASKNENIPVIIAGFDTMMEEYANVTSAIRIALEVDGGIAPGDDGDDPEIMEFLPE